MTPRCSAWPVPAFPLSDRGVAVTTDSNPRACALDPRAGTALTLAEGVANLACVGATPVAVVNCLNFGNPEHPEVMWQLSECIDGMAEACRALSLPVIGGNVSLYNESGGADIDPTPVLGLLGLVEALHAPTPRVGLAGGRHPGAPAGPPCRGGRIVPPGRDALGHRAPAAPRRDAAGPRLRRPRRACAPSWPGWSATIVAGGHDAPLLHAVHDVSSGGLSVTLAEMAVAAGTGCDVGVGAGALDDPAELFTELPSRFVVATTEPDELAARATSLGIPCSVLGRAGGDRVTLGDLVDLPLEALREAHEGNLARLLGDS